MEIEARSARAWLCDPAVARQPCSAAATARGVAFVAVDRDVRQRRAAGLVGGGMHLPVARPHEHQQADAERRRGRARNLDA